MKPIAELKLSDIMSQQLLSVAPDCPLGEAARRMGFSTEEYQHHVMIYSNNGPGSFGGRASAPGSNLWLKSTSDGTFWHEMGHNLGPIHANRWDTSGKSVIGPGVNGEYGNSFDVLGSSGSGMNGHFNASFKRQIGWLTTDLFTPVTSSGTYRIWQFDQPLADPGRPRRGHRRGRTRRRPTSPHR